MRVRVRSFTARGEFIGWAYADAGWLAGIRIGVSLSVSRLRPDSLEFDKGDRVKIIFAALATGEKVLVVPNETSMRRIAGFDPSPTLSPLIAQTWYAKVA